MGCLVAVCVVEDACDGGGVVSGVGSIFFCVGVGIAVC